MKQTPESTEPILIECDLPEPPEKVWRALTEPQWLAQWLLPCDLRPEVGARFQFRPAAAEGVNRAGGAPIDCEVLEVEPQRRLRWVQREQGDSAPGSATVESFVTVELSGVPNGGTHLRLIHDGFAIVSRSATVIELRPRSTRAVCMLRRAA